MLEQTAEECAELAQACLKLARIYRKENPTPKSEAHALDDFYEEVADVRICLEELFSSIYVESRVENWEKLKKDRLESRFD